MRHEIWQNGELLNVEEIPDTPEQILARDISEFYNAQTAGVKLATKELVDAVRVLVITGEVAQAKEIVATYPLLNSLTPVRNAILAAFNTRFPA